MKLYYTPGACSLAIHIALREVGASFELVRVDLATRKLPDGGNYTDIAPRGYVPLLELPDGSRRTEAASLLQYVADLEPSQRLIGPPGTARRLAVVEWLTFIATELHKAFGWLFRRDTAESTRATVVEKLGRHCAELEQRSASAEWLAGDFSVADAYAFTTLSWASLLALPMQECPNLRAYLARVASRPRVRDSLVAEGLAG
jgi:glutathione S-transferase